MPQPIQSLLNRLRDDLARATHDPSGLKAGGSQIAALVQTWRQIYEQNRGLARVTPTEFEALLTWLGTQSAAERLAFASRFRSATQPLEMQAFQAALGQLQLMGEMLSNIMKARSDMLKAVTANLRA